VVSPIIDVTCSEHIFDEFEETVIVDSAAE
jgi:hypothetical protein